jgi:tRNA A37 N6-isopentenylltransferase MiaA
LAIDNQSRLVVGSDNGLYIYDPATNKIWIPEEDGQANSIFNQGSIKYNQILKDHEGTLWFATQYGLSVLTYNGQSYTLGKEEGLEKLQEILKNLDEEYYNVVHKENPRRLLRAIDVIWQTGRKYSEIIAEPKHKRDFKVVRIGITAPREIMYERINLRVDKMLENGLIDEVKSLTEYQKLVPLQTVGYTEIFKYLEGTWDLDFAIEEIKKNSRRYAKRQETWNRKVENVTWLPYDYSVEQLHEILSKIEK